MQDIFLQLWRKPDAFDSSRGSLVAWLAVIARHRAIDRLRQRRPETDIEEVVIAGDTDLRDETERSLVIEKVRAALGEMNADQRKALELAYFQGLTHTRDCGEDRRAAGYDQDPHSQRAAGLAREVCVSRFEGHGFRL